MKRTLGSNWNCTQSPGCASIVFGANTKVPFAEPTLTTQTFSFPPATVALSPCDAEPEVLLEKAGEAAGLSAAPVGAEIAETATGVTLMTSIETTVCARLHVTSDRETGRME
jgi:hypothetical protein